VLRAGRWGAPVARRVLLRESAPLHAAASSGDEDAIAALLEAGADLDATDDSGDTPLAEAVKSRHAKAARLLWGRGANL